jgi:hypothetical protein
MLIEREDLKAQIEALFEGWDHSTPARRSSAHAVLVAAKLDDFQREAESLREYAELQRSGIFDRLRAFKRKLGDLYFEPEITAAAVECNIVVGNVFNRLLASANEKLGERVTEGLDVAGAFYDAAPGSEQYVTEIPSELRGEPAENESAGGSGGKATVNDLLELVCEGTGLERRDRDSESGPRDPERTKTSEAASHSLPCAQKRLEPLFFTLSQPQPDLAALRDHMRKFADIDEIDLKDFIGRPEDPSDHLCRNVLGVVLWVEELCEHELNQKGEMSSGLKDELHRLLRKSEEFSEQLDYLVRENSSTTNNNRLLIVSNKLLEARLKLKRGIARFTRRNLAPAPAPEALRVETVVEEVHPVTAPRFEITNGRTSPWLIGATLLVCVVSGIIYLIDQQMGSFIPVPKDVEILDVRRLPMGEHMQQAFRKNGLVFITAKSSWAQMPEEDQRQNLQELIEYPSKTKVTKVMITDGMGRILGDVSPEGTRILGKVQIADSNPTVEPQEIPSN